MWVFVIVYSPQALQMSTFWGDLRAGDHFNFLLHKGFFVKYLIPPFLDFPRQLHLPEGASCDVILSSLVSGGHFFLQQPTHPTYPSLSTLDQCMIGCYAQGDTPPLPHPVEGENLESRHIFHFCKWMLTTWDSVHSRNKKGNGLIWEKEHFCFTMRRALYKSKIHQKILQTFTNNL